MAEAERPAKEAVADRAGTMDIRVSVRVRPMLDKMTQEEPAVEVPGPNLVSLGHKTYTYPASVVVGSDQASAFSDIAGTMMGATRSSTTSPPPPTAAVTITTDNQPT